MDCLRDSPPRLNRSESWLQEPLQGVGLAFECGTCDIVATRMAADLTDCADTRAQLSPGDRVARPEPSISACGLTALLDLVLTRLFEFAWHFWPGPTDKISPHGPPAGCMAPATQACPVSDKNFRVTVSWSWSVVGQVHPTNPLHFAPDGIAHSASSSSNI